MAIETTIKCDVCGIRKQQANHWYRVAVQGKKFMSSSLDASPKPWNGEKQVCGPGHAQTLFQRFLSTATLEMEMHPDFFAFNFTYVPRRVVELAIKAGLKNWQSPQVDRMMSRTARQAGVPMRVVEQERRCLELAARLVRLFL